MFWRWWVCLAYTFHFYKKFITNFELKIKDCFYIFVLMVQVSYIRLYIQSCVFFLNLKIFGPFGWGWLLVVDICGRFVFVIMVELVWWAMLGNVGVGKRTLSYVYCLHQAFLLKFWGICLNKFFGGWGVKLQACVVFHKFGSIVVVRWVSEWWHLTTSHINNNSSIVIKLSKHTIKPYSSCRNNNSTIIKPFKHNHKAFFFL